MRLDWTDLRIFLQVCEAGSMTAAAERCHLTLAAISARMRGLEESCGVLLLERKARGVVPTAAGDVLAAHARIVTDQVLLLERDLRHKRSHGARSTLILANSSALARGRIDAAAGRQAMEAGRPVVVRESPSEATVEALRCGMADVGIVSDAVDVRGLVAEDLGPDPLVLVAALTHALATRLAVGFREALADAWIAWGERNALSAHLRMRALALDVPLEPRITYPTLGGVLRLVGSGLGVTILPEASVQAHPAASGLARIPIDEAWARRRLLVCRPAGGDAWQVQLAARIVESWRAR